MSVQWSRKGRKSLVRKKNSMINSVIWMLLHAYSYMNVDIYYGKGLLNVGKHAHPHFQLNCIFASITRLEIYQYIISY